MLKYDQVLFEFGNSKPSVPICFWCDKHHDQKKFSEKRVYFSLLFLVHYQSKPRQKPKERPWKKAACWLTFHGLISLLSYTAQEPLPRESTVQVSQAQNSYYSRKFLTDILLPNLMEASLQLRSLFLADSNLCQADQKLTNTLSIVNQLLSVTVT